MRPKYLGRDEKEVGKGRRMRLPFLFDNRLVWRGLRAMQCAIGAWLMAAMSAGVCDIRSRGFEHFLMFSPAPYALPVQRSGGDETIPEKRSGRLKAFRRKAHFESISSPRILSFYRFRENSGATAIGGMFRTRSVHRSASPHRSTNVYRAPWPISHQAWLHRASSTHHRPSPYRILTARPSSRSVNSRYQSVDRSIESR